jgi:hypothetical protein
LIRGPASDRVVEEKDDDETTQDGQLHPQAPIPARREERQRDQSRHRMESFQIEATTHNDILEHKDDDPGSDEEKSVMA